MGRAAIDGSFGRGGLRFATQPRNPPMTNDMMNLRALVEKAPDGCQSATKRDAECAFKKDSRLLVIGQQ